MNKINQKARFFILSLIICIVVNIALSARPLLNSKDSTFRIIRVTPQFGIVIPHHEQMIYFINNYSYGLDINYGITKFNKSWYQYLNYPEVGVGVFYNSFGNPDIFGYGLSVYGYIQSNLYRSKKFNIRSKVALGPGFVNKPYNAEKNPYNHVFGSAMNVYISMGVLARFKISPRWAISSDLYFNHLSNGAIKKPNHGINTVTSGFGVEYNLNNRSDLQLSGSVSAPKSNARDILVFLGYGRSQRSLYKPINYSAISLNVNHLWWISRKTAWGVGIDWIYYGAAPYEYLGIDLPNASVPDNYSFTDKMYGCVFGSYNFRFNNTQIFAHVGVYLLYTVKPEQAIYPRLGIRQRIVNDLYANFSIKASIFKAEFIELGLGYRFNYKKNNL